MKFTASAEKGLCEGKKKVGDFLKGLWTLTSELVNMPELLWETSLSEPSVETLREAEECLLLFKSFRKSESA